MITFNNKTDSFWLRFKCEASRKNTYGVRTPDYIQSRAFSDAVHMILLVALENAVCASCV